MSKYKAQKRDYLGTRIGTVAAKVNRVMTRQWKTARQIQQESRQPFKSVTRRLHHGVEKGLYLRQHIIRFKLKKKAPIK